MAYANIEHTYPNPVFSDEDVFRDVSQLSTEERCFSSFGLWMKSWQLSVAIHVREKETGTTLLF